MTISRYLKCSSGLIWVSTTHMRCLVLKDSKDIGTLHTVFNNCGGPKILCISGWYKILVCLPVLPEANIGPRKSIGFGIFLGLLSRYTAFDYENLLSFTSG